jgi:hypothetical protein
MILYGPGYPFDSGCSSMTPVWAPMTPRHHKHVWLQDEPPWLQRDPLWILVEPLLSHSDPLWPQVILYESRRIIYDSRVILYDFWMSLYYPRVILYDPRLFSTNPGWSSMTPWWFSTTVVRTLAAQRWASTMPGWVCQLWSDPLRPQVILYEPRVSTSDSEVISLQDESLRLQVSLYDYSIVILWTIRLKYFSTIGLQE